MVPSARRSVVDVSASWAAGPEDEFVNVLCGRDEVVAHVGGLEIVTATRVDRRVPTPVGDTAVNSPFEVGDTGLDPTTSTV